MARKENRKGSEPGITGMLQGLGDLLEKLQQLAETGQELKRTGEIHGPEKELKGIYGFTVKVGGLGQEGPRVEPFGNIRRDRSSGRTVVEQTREPMLDLFEEQDHVLIVCEMPGITAGDVKLSVEGTTLTISAARGDKRYSKQVELPSALEAGKMTIAANNGVVEIKCPR